MSATQTHFEVLENGLTLLLRESRLAPVVDLQIWAQVGSADERPGEAGLAHFHEHMLFKGTDRRGVGEVAAEIEGAGGRINAYTSFDVTVYYATLPSAMASTGVSVLSDAVRHSVFDPAEIEREIEVVLEEIRRAEDSPLHVLSDAVFAEAYRVHPYRLPILGPSESVSQFDREKVRSFFEHWYGPDNLVFVAVGDFDATELAGEIRAAFAGAEPAGAQRRRPSEPPQRELRDVILHRPFERVRLDLSWPAPSFRSPDAIHVDLLSYILGECESSRLIRRVRESEGLADRIDSGAYTPFDPGLFSVGVDVDAARALDAIRATVREVERVRRERVSDEELERARANFLSAEHFERESVSGQGRKLGSFHVLGGDWQLEAGYFDAIKATTADDLLQAARKYLGPDQLTAGVLLPEGESNGLDRDAIERTVAEGVAATERTLATPARLDTPSARTGTPSVKSAGGDEIHSYRLEGGGVLHVAPRHDVPVVAARAAFLGGLLAETTETAGLSHFLSNVWMRGTRARSAADFARAVENLAADIDGFSGRSSLGLTLDVTSDKFLPTLDLLAEVLVEPGLDPEEIGREQRETLAAIERREDNLAQLAFQLFSKTLFGEDHPYALSMLGERETVGSFDAAMLRSHHARVIRAPGLVIGLAGDVDPDAAAEAFSSRLSALPGESPLTLAPPVLTPPSEIRHAELRKDRAQAHLVLGFPGLTVSDPDRHALEVITQVLAGQGGRLFLELRDRQGLAYAVNAINMEGWAPGFFTIYIATAPDKVDAAHTGILTELERLLRDPVPEDELDRARRYLTGNFVIDQQRSAARAGQIALDALYGLGPDFHRHYTAAINAVCADDVRRVAERVLLLDAYTEAIVRP